MDLLDAAKSFVDARRQLEIARRKTQAPYGSMEIRREAKSNLITWRQRYRDALADLEMAVAEEDARRVRECVCWRDAER